MVQLNIMETLILGFRIEILDSGSITSLACLSDNGWKTLSALPA